MSMTATKSTSADWLEQSVLSFWQGVNWENSPIVAAAATNGSDGKATVLSMELTVQQYLAAIPWSGVGEIAAMPQTSNQESAQADEVNDTLDDFLDDISQFF
jgi:hypothetical protein